MLKHKIYLLAIAFSLSLYLCKAASQEMGLDFEKKVFFTVGKTKVWKILGEDTFFFEAGMAIDADGASDTYHPDDIGKDFLAMAGRPGNWGALVTDTGRPDGTPIIQGADHPNQGYYISTTSLEDKSKERTDPQRYANSKEIPYVVLPMDKRGGAKLGDFSVVINRKNGRLSSAIFADIGPKNKIGEGSIALAEVLGINSNPKYGGIDDGIVYIVFPNSGNGKPKPLSEINSRSKKLFNDWGGMKRLKACFPEKLK